MKTEYDFDQYQFDAATTAIYPLEKALEYLSLGLASECGELTGHIAKWYRKDTEFPRAAVKAELGDILWFVSELSRYLEFGLADVAEENIKKLASRSERGVLKGNGDTR
jgi:NTP pyrophosphatase (non-canonical NTP hydrolase)